MENNQEFVFLLPQTTQGQRWPKECHWHPQIPNLLITTALDGLNVFKPVNLEENPDDVFGPEGGDEEGGDEEEDGDNDEEDDKEQQ